VKVLAAAHLGEALSEFASVAEKELMTWGSKARHLKSLKPWEHGLDPPSCPKRIGWKHGPTLFLLPVLQHLTKGRFTFVHLVRDGRDMAFSRNRNNLAKYNKYGGQVVGLFGLKKRRGSANFVPEFNKCSFKVGQEHRYRGKWWVVVVDGGWLVDILVVESKHNACSHDLFLCF
jgi:hypothetical protein